jgi:transposase
MAKVTFKSQNQGQVLLFPCSLEEKIPQGSPSRLVNQIVEDLDIQCLLRTCKGGRTGSYHPRMMLKVLFLSYLNNIYSCRKIEKQIRENIHYMWLAGGEEPDFRTVNDFRGKRLKDHINTLFTQVVLLLNETGYISLEKQYVDGTKIEPVASRYTFVWRKTVEKNKEKLENKIRDILSRIEEGIDSDAETVGVEAVATPIDSEALKSRIASIKKTGRAGAKNDSTIGGKSVTEIAGI